MNEIFNLDDMINKPEIKNIEEEKVFCVEYPSDSEPESEENDLKEYYVPLMYTIFDCYYTKAKSEEEALENAKHYIEKDFCEYDGYMASPKYFEYCITEDEEEAYKTMSEIAEDMNYIFIG